MAMFQRSPDVRSGETSPEHQASLQPRQLPADLGSAGSRGTGPGVCAEDLECRDRDNPLPGRSSERSHILLAVAAFHSAFGLPFHNLPTIDVPADLGALRVRLLAEEVDEFAHAVAARDLVGIADALADVVYVAFGSAVTYGIDLDAVFAEVHRSNMSKLDARGRPVLRADGKVLKSSRYTPPDIAGVLHQQLPLPW
jgi:predicted HAD superfamily Cof-like phosphohydrolase